MMKISKKILFSIFVVISFCLFVSSVKAEFTTDYQYITDDENNNVVIKKYIGSGGYVVIPASARISNENYAVVIDGSLFLNNKDVTSVRVKSGVTLKNGYRLFYGADKLTNVVFEKDIITNELENTSQMFYNTTALTTLDLGNLDTSHVTNMGGMFQSCRAAYIDISMLDMRAATNQESMFSTHDLKKIKLGSKNVFNVSSDSIKAVSFGRGTWRRVDDGKEFSALEIAKKTESQDMSGTYEFVSEVSTEILPKFLVTYKINFSQNDVVITDKSANSHFKLVDSKNQKNKYLYYELIKNSNEFTTDSSEYVVLKIVDAVTDKDDNLYDLQIKIDSFVIDQMPDDQSIDSAIYLLLQSNGSLLFANTIYANKDALINGEGNVTAGNGTSNYDVEFKVIDKSGNPVNGSFIFSAYDLDMPANVSYGDTNYISNITPNYGFGLHSEGVNLYSGGFDENTLLKSKTVSYIYDISTGLPNGVFRRLTGSRSDAASEASEFAIKADSKGAKVQFTFGRNAGISVISNYQPKNVRIENRNDFGEVLIDSHFILKDEDGNTIEEWDTTETPERYFLNPGKYTITQVSVKDGYPLAKDTVFYVGMLDKIIVDGKETTNDLITIINSKDATVAGKCKSEKINGIWHYYDTKGNEISKDEWPNKCQDPVPTGSQIPYVAIGLGSVLVLLIFTVVKKKSRIKNI